MELIKEDGKYYIKADVTELVEQVKAMVVKTEAPVNPDMNQDLYPKDTTPDPEPVEEVWEEVTYLKGPLGPQWGIPGELQDPPYRNVPRYDEKPEFDPPEGYEWKSHIWGWYWHES